MQYTLTIPNWTPTLTNHWYGKHWRVRYKLKRAQNDIVAAYAMQQQIPQATCRRRLLIQVWGWPTGRKPDLDSFDKLLLDAIRDCGLILDDSERGLEGRMLVEVHRSRERKTVITLEDC